MCFRAAAWGGGNSVVGREVKWAPVVLPDERVSGAAWLSSPSFSSGTPASATPGEQDGELSRTMSEFYYVLYESVSLILFTVRRHSVCLCFF